MSASAHIRLGLKCSGSHTFLNLYVVCVVYYEIVSIYNSIYICTKSPYQKVEVCAKFSMVQLGVEGSENIRCTGMK